MQTKMAESFSTGKVLERVSWGEGGISRKQGASLAVGEEILSLGGACGNICVPSMMQTGRLGLSEDAHEPKGILTKGTGAGVCQALLPLWMSVFVLRFTAPLLLLQEGLEAEGNFQVGVTCCCPWEC